MKAVLIFFFAFLALAIAEGTNSINQESKNQGIQDNSRFRNCQSMFIGVYMEKYIGKLILSGSDSYDTAFVNYSASQAVFSKTEFLELLGEGLALMAKENPAVVDMYFPALSAIRFTTSFRNIPIQSGICMETESGNVLFVNPEFYNPSDKTLNRSIASLFLLASNRKPLPGELRQMVVQDFNVVAVHEAVHAYQNVHGVRADTDGDFLADTRALLDPRAIRLPPGAFPQTVFQARREAEAAAVSAIPKLPEYFKNERWFALHLADRNKEGEFFSGVFAGVANSTMPFQERRVLYSQLRKLEEYLKEGNESGLVEFATLIRGNAPGNCVLGYFQDGRYSETEVHYAVPGESPGAYDRFLPGFLPQPDIISPETGIPVLKDSPSWIFRSTHIVKVRIIDFAPEPTGTNIAGREPKHPMMKLHMDLREIIKGDVAGLPGEEAQGIYVYYPPHSPARARLPGVWSYFDLSPGQEFYLFCEFPGQGNSLSDIISERNLKQVIEATPDFAKNIEFIRQLEINAIPGRDLLRQAGKIADDLDGFFLEYLLAKPSFQCMKDHQIFESLLALLENHELAMNARTFLESNICSLFVMQPPDDAWYAERFAVSLFRLLRLEQADIPNTIGTFLPNHLGLEGGGNKLTARDVFKNYPAERGRAIDVLGKHYQEEYALELLNWLGQEGRKMSQDELIELGRDECVRLAAEIFMNKHPLSNFSPVLFSRARVWIQGKSVWVIFSQDVEYYPLNFTPAIRSVAMDLVSGAVSVQDADDKYTCYVHTQASRKAVDFVLGHLRGDKELGGTMQGLGSDIGLKIEEKETDYVVTLVARTFDYSCRVDKNTGMIANRVQGELEPDPYAEPEEKPRELK